MPGAGEYGGRGSGGQVEEMVIALIDSAHDKNSDVRLAISLSILELGRKKPEMVLGSCNTYLVKHTKLSQEHRVVILNAMERIIKDTLDSLGETLAKDIVREATDELTRTKDVIPEWQTAASGVLVAVGQKYCNTVMDELLQKFSPGVLPHFFVVQTMANLASANVHGMVPFLQVVLGTMLPMLGMAKHDNMKWVFSYALARFSEAVLDYVANLEKAPDPTVRKEAFSAEIYSAYDVLFNVWLQSKEAKLRLAIVEALGHMSHLMEIGILQEQLPKIINGILALYKKHPDPFHVTQGLCMILDAATADGSTILEPQLDMLLNMLFTQVCSPIDFGNALAIKNHNEILRCFAVIAKSFSDKLVAFLLQKLEGNNEKLRIGTLTIIKHLVNAADPYLENKKSVVLAGLKIVLNDNSNKVKKAFAQVVVAMAHHDYLELEGGQLMVEFVVRQCALQADTGKRSNDAEYVSNTALRLMCDNILKLITTTIDHMDAVLWPYLLEFLVPEHFTEAVGVVAMNVAYLANKKREENGEDSEIDYETLPNIPRPAALIARLVVMAGLPNSGRNRGTHVLQAMKGLSPNLHDNLVALWDTVIPKLIQFLEDSQEEDKWSQKTWEDLLLKMLSKSLDEVDSEDWVCEIGEALGQQLTLYSTMSEEKNFLYKCLGIVMRKSTKKDFVTKHLALIFSSVKHTSQLEREGCAISFGFCAASHLDAVLAKLETVSKTEMSKKSGGILGFIKDNLKSDVDIEQIKATVMLCYGFVTLYAPPTIITSRVETTILRSISPYFNNIKDTSVKQNLIRTAELIGKSLHPDHLQAPFTFTNRGMLITNMQNYMKGEGVNSINNETRALAMNSCATLVKLDPKLPEAEVFDLVKVSTDCVLPLPPDGINPKTKTKEESYDATVEQEVLMEATTEALNDLLKELLVKDLTAVGLESVVKHLLPWMVSLHFHERERSMKVLHTLLQHYLEKFQPQAYGNSQSFTNFGVMLGHLVPRCSDPEISIRQLSIDCIQTVLRIQLQYEGHLAGDKDTMVDALPTLRDRVKKSDPNVLFSVVNDLSKVLAKKVNTKTELIAFIDTLFDGLMDAQSHCSSGACVVLNSIFKLRGGELYSEVERVIETLHEKLSQIEFPQTKTGTLRSIRTLATHHLVTSLNVLLNYPIPFDENMREIWKIMAQDGQLAASILDNLMDLITRSLPYDEKFDERDKDKMSTRTATYTPLAATFAITEMCRCEEIEPQVNEVYHRLLSVLMMRVASSVRVLPPPPPKKDDRPKEKDAKSPRTKKTSTSKANINPSNVSIESLRGFLQISKSEDILEHLDQNNSWSKFEDNEEYMDGFTSLAQALVTSKPEQVSKVVAVLSPSISSLYDVQRVAVAAFFSELVKQKCAGDLTLVELLVNSLLGRLVDQSSSVRMLCIRGMGNIAHVGTAQVQKFSTTVLSAMMAGMDDRDDLDDDITLESMEGLSKILINIDESHIRAILINIALKIRPCFEKDKAAVRAAAFTLFGNLSKFGDGPSKDPFLEQVHANFVSLLLHLNDPEPEVRKACKFALRQIGPLIGSKSMNDMFQKHLPEDANLHYGEFINDLAKVIINDFLDKVNFYVMGNVQFFRSNWSEIKCNAAVNVGFLMGNLPSIRHNIISKEHVCQALIILLKDPSTEVRMRSAEAMSLLYDY